MMEKAIKQRLLGGLVLVAGAALFLPVLLDGSGASLTIPPMPKAPEVAGVEALAPRLDPKVAETEKAVDTAHAGRDEAAAAGEGGDVAPDAAAVAAGDAAATTATTPAAKPAAAMAPAGKAPASAAGSAKAAPAATAPAAAVAPNHVAAATTAIATPPQSVAAAAPARVQAPAATPAKPQAAPAAVVPARPVAVVSLPATAKAAAPADKPATPRATDKPVADKPLPGAWLVQVGVFSSRDKAQALVQQLRRKGYAAVLNPQGDHFKVVVGPELNRSVADSIKSRLAADPELKLNGWVQAYKP